MSRGKQRVRETEVTKAARGAIKAGIAVQRIEIDRQGNIVVFAGPPAAPSALDQVNEWDAV